MINPREQTSLICELKQGRELANQLKNQLDPIISRETCDELLHKIVSTYDKALSVLDWRPLSVKREHPSVGKGLLLESSLSTDSSKDQDYQPNDVYKKRKTQPRWSEQVRVCSGAGTEGPLVDGHSWRKYGQKDILGAKFPRAYYRCTHRNTQGCLATKQVQRTDENSSIFEVTYKGRHSCIQASTSSSSASKVASSVKEIPKPLLKEKEDKPKQGKVLNLEEEGIKVETEDLMNATPPPPPITTTTTTREEIFPFFSLPFTPTESESLETQFFSDPLEENDLMGCYSPPFLTPTSSDSNYYCKIDDFIICSIMEKSESDLTDSTATPTSVTNSPFGDLEISFDQGDFDPDFPLDTFGL